MYFINLEKLKIQKEYDARAYTGTFAFDINMPIATVREKMHQVFQDMVLEYGAPTLFVLDLGHEGEVATEEEAEDFVNITNVAIMEFFKALIIDGGRRREHRLDVPDKLKIVKMSYSLLKRAINSRTKVDVFNLIITYKDLKFILCDEKGYVDNAEFVHDFNELKEKLDA